MKHTSNLRLVSFILCGLLLAAAVLTFIGCDGTNPEDLTIGGADIIASYDSENPLHRGSGKTEFHFSVTDGAGTTSYWVIHTDKATVGEALEALGLIAGEEGTYGLYVKTVTGLTVDYDTDKAYWAFYENGQYAMTGADKTPIVAGASYAFKVEKG